MQVLSRFAHKPAPVPADGPGQVQGIPCKIMLHVHVVLISGGSRICTVPVPYNPVQNA